MSQMYVICYGEKNKIRKNNLKWQGKDGEISERLVKKNLIEKIMFSGKNLREWCIIKGTGILARKNKKGKEWGGKSKLGRDAGVGGAKWKTSWKEW